MAAREIEYQGPGGTGEAGGPVVVGDVVSRGPGLPAGLDRDAGGVPHLSERQLIWVTHRLSTLDDLEACVAANVPADEVIEWRKNPAFGEFVARCLEDKRSSFRDLNSHLLPAATRSIWNLLTSENLKDQAKGAQMLLRAQGQFLDVTRIEDADAMSRLLDKLRTPSRVEIVDVEPRP